jgi:thiol-disulfide isomerase/thioredoxin
MSLLHVVVLALAITVQPAAQTPQDCVKAARDFAAQRLNELGGATGETIRLVTAERLTMIRACAARFDLSKMPAAELGPLTELYVEAQQLDLAQQALARGLADQSIDPVSRANLLAVAVRTTLRQPKSPERNALAERYMDSLDGLGLAALDSQITAHAALNGYYRGDDIDSGIIRHSTWLISTGKGLDAARRKQYMNTIVAAHLNLAEARAGQGENDRALELLNTAITDWADSPAAVARVNDVLARYKLVGTAAPPIEAHSWLNRSGSDPLDLKGRATLLQFTAHWCGPCKESYPGMKRLLERFGTRDFQVVFYTRTYGYFEGERNLSPEQEIDRDRKYFAGYGFDLPIAVGSPSSIVIDGKSTFQEDPYEKAFAVGGIPQINLIDADGKIRLVMIGYDDANEEKLASIIELVLKEKKR